MNNEELLKKILKSKELNKFWKDVDIDTINRNTLLRSNNKYLKSLHYIINDNAGTKKVKIESIFKLFNL